MTTEVPLKLAIRRTAQPTVEWQVGYVLSLPSPSTTTLFRPLLTAPSQQAAIQTLDELGADTDPWRALVKILWLQSGEVLADLLSQEHGSGDTEEERNEATGRLANKHFRRGDVFHANRWMSHGRVLQRAFDGSRGDGSWQEAWSGLATAHILEAFAAMTDTTEVGCVFRRVRRAVCAAIERELLGRTLDAGDPTTKLANDLTMSTDDILDQAFERTDLLAALAGLHPDESQLLLEYYDPETDREAMAARLGINIATLWQRVSRSRRKLVL